ncbi:hypothetical protein D9M69_731910 [compost metagenome]
MLKEILIKQHPQATEIRVIIGQGDHKPHGAHIPEAGQHTLKIDAVTHGIGQIGSKAYGHQPHDSAHVSCLKQKCTGRDNDRSQQ